MSFLKISKLKLVNKQDDFYIFDVIVRLRRGKEAKKYVRLRFISLSESIGYNNDIVLYLIMDCLNTKFDSDILENVRIYNKRKLENFLKRINYKENDYI